MKDLKNKDEIKWKKKWELIPDSVHECYIRAYESLMTEILKNIPDSKGLIYWITHPEEYKQWHSYYQEVLENAKPKFDALYNWYYGPYGIEPLNNQSNNNGQPKD